MSQRKPSSQSRASLQINITGSDNFSKDYPNTGKILNSSTLDKDILSSSHQVDDYHSNNNEDKFKEELIKEKKKMTSSRKTHQNTISSLMAHSNHLNIDPPVSTKSSKSTGDLQKKKKKKFQSKQQFQEHFNSFGNEEDNFFQSEEKKKQKQYQSSNPSPQSYGNNIGDDHQSGNLNHEGDFSSPALGSYYSSTCYIIQNLPLNEQIQREQYKKELLENVEGLTNSLQNTVSLSSEIMSGQQDTLSKCESISNEQLDEIKQLQKKLATMSRQLQGLHRWKKKAEVKLGFGKCRVQSNEESEGTLEYRNQDVYSNDSSNFVQAKKIKELEEELEKVYQDLFKYQSQYEQKAREQEDKIDQLKNQTEKQSVELFSKDEQIAKLLGELNNCDSAALNLEDQANYPLKTITEQAEQIAQLKAEIAELQIELQSRSNISDLHPKTKVEINSDQEDGFGYLENQHNQQTWRSDNFQIDNFDKNNDDFIINQEANENGLENFINNHIGEDGNKDTNFQINKDGNQNSQNHHNYHNLQQQQANKHLKDNQNIDEFVELNDQGFSVLLNELLNQSNILQVFIDGNQFPSNLYSLAQIVSMNNQKILEVINQDSKDQQICQTNEPDSQKSKQDSLSQQQLTLQENQDSNIFLKDSQVDSQIFLISSYEDNNSQVKLNDKQDEQQSKIIEEQNASSFEKQEKHTSSSSFNKQEDEQKKEKKIIEENNVTLEEQHNNSQNDLDPLNNQVLCELLKNEELKNKLQLLEQQIEVQTQNNEKIHLEKQEEISKLKEQVNHHIQVLKESQEKVKEQERQIQHSNEKANETQNIISQLNKDLQEKIDSLTKELEHTKQQLEQSIKKIAEQEEKIKQLNDKIQEQEKQISCYLNQIEEGKKQMNILIQEHNKEKEQIIKDNQIHHQNEIDKITVQCKSLEEQIQIEQKQNKENEQHLQNKDTQIELLMGHIEKAKKEMTYLKIEIDSENQSLKKLLLEYENAKITNLQQNQVLISKQQKEIESLSENQQQQKKDISTLQSELNSKQEIINEQDKMIKETKYINAQLKDQKETMTKQQSEQMEQERTQFLNQLDQLYKQIEALKVNQELIQDQLKKQIETLKENQELILKQKEDELKSLKKSFAIEKNTVLKLQSELVQNQETLNQQDKIISETQNRNAQMNKQIQLLQEESISLKDQSKQLKDENNQLKDQNRELKLENIEAKNHMKVMSLRINDLISQIQIISNKNSQLLASNKSLQLETESSQKKLKEFSLLIIQNKAEIATLSEECKIFERNKANLSLQIEYLNKDIERIEYSNQSLKQKLQAEQEISKNLQNKIQDQLNLNLIANNKIQDQLKQIEALQINCKQQQQDSLIYKNRVAFLENLQTSAFVNSILSNLLSVRNNISQQIFEVISQFMRELHTHIQSSPTPFFTEFYTKTLNSLQEQADKFNCDSELIYNLLVSDNSHGIQIIKSFYQPLSTHLTFMLRTILNLTSEVFHQIIDLN